LVWLNTLRKEKNRMKYLQLIILSLFIIGCTTETDEPGNDEANTEANDAPVDDKEELVVIKGKTYTQYYPGKKNIQFVGPQDEQKRRNGKWTHYSEDGKELGITIYKHGVMHGHLTVKRRNGTIHYHGEMNDGKKVGIWKTYDENGTLVSEDDFGEKE
jgi:antitoxin component YwqK of YwqJK toxin-antitoxin module